MEQMIWTFRLHSIFFVICINFLAVGKTQNLISMLKPILARVFL